MPAGDASSFDKFGYAGPFRLDDQTIVQRLTEFVSGQPSKRRWNWALSKLGLACDQRVNQEHGHIAFRPIYDAATQPQLLDGIENLLGPDVLLWKARVIVRDPGDDGKGWHVDRDNMLLGGVHLTIAVTDVTPENGSVLLIPNTHKYDVSLQQAMRNGELQRLNATTALALADRTHSENAPHQIVSMTLRAGEYYFTRGGLWHCVLPNESKEQRIILVARYMRPDIKSHHWSQSDKAVRVLKNKSLPCILVRGTDRFHLNTLHDPPRPKT